MRARVVGDGWAFPSLGRGRLDFGNPIRLIDGQEVELAEVRSATLRGPLARLARRLLARLAVPIQAEASAGVVLIDGRPHVAYRCELEVLQ